ncbi:hypothetical protein [Kiloniella sp. b19]|uniref:hypothetical protein n=1 Tax=Kiloniella sp. GXU_MW_B19 TaxID=3141326 RepID=UPI0031DD8553
MSAVFALAFVTGAFAQGTPAVDDNAVITNSPDLYRIQEGSGTATSEPQPSYQLPSQLTPKTEEEQARQENIAACDAFARALIEHDNRIADDRSGVFDNVGGGGLGFNSFSREVDRAEEDSIRERHFRRCMESKGYGS